MVVPTPSCVMSKHTTVFLPFQQSPRTRRLLPQIPLRARTGCPVLGECALPGQHQASPKIRRGAAVASSSQDRPNGVADREDDEQGGSAAGLSISCSDTHASHHVTGESAGSPQGPGAQPSLIEECMGVASEECAAGFAAHRASLGHMSRGAGRLIRNTRNRARNDIHKVASLIALPTWLLPTSLLAVSHGAHAMLWGQAMAGALLGSVFACLDRYCNVRMHVAPSRPLTVVLTGGSKGLGKAMARELLMAGDQVLITSRSQTSLDAALKDLQYECGSRSKVFGAVCDVSDPQDVQRLEERALETLGRVDVWINNAAYSGAFQPFVEMNTKQLSEVVSTNLMGVLFCSRQALSLFAKQPDGYGHLFNMDGAGADGLPTPNYAAYGATKAGILQLTRTLEQDAKDTGAHVHMLSPGMILTNLLLEGATTANKQAFNLLAEHPETPAAFLVPRIRTAVARGLKGTYAKYLTPPRVVLKLLSAPFFLNKFFDGEGNAVYMSEHERIYGRGAKSTARSLAAARSRKGGLQLAYSLSLAFAVALCLVDASYGSGASPH